MSGATVAIGADLWSPPNPASSAFGTGRVAGVSFARPFGLRQLDLLSLDVAFPTGRVRTSVGVERFGFALYRRDEARLTVAAKLPRAAGAGAVIGVRIGLERTSGDGFHPSSAGRLSVGWVFSPTSRLRVGASATDLASMGGADAGRDGRRRLCAGVAQFLGESLLLAVAVEKPVHQAPAILTAVEATVVKGFSLRGGMGTSPDRVSLGLGLAPGFYEVDLAAVHHAWLGWSPSLSVSSTW